MNEMCALALFAISRQMPYCQRETVDGGLVMLRQTHNHKPLPTLNKAHRKLSTSKYYAYITTHTRPFTLRVQVRASIYYFGTPLSTPIPGYS